MKRRSRLARACRHAAIAILAGTVSVVGAVAFEAPLWTIAALALVPLTALIVPVVAFYRIQRREELVDDAGNVRHPLQHLGELALTVLGLTLYILAELVLQAIVGLFIALLAAIFSC